MSTPSIGDCIGKGVEFLKKDIVFAIVGLICAGIPILSFATLPNYYKAIKRSFDGEKPQIGELFDFSPLVPGLIAMILGGIAIQIGMILLIIPGLIIMPIVPLAIYLISQGETDGIGALKKGWAIHSKNLVGNIITLIVLGIVGGIGSIAFGIGALITYPIAMGGIVWWAAGAAGEGDAAASNETQAEEAVAEEPADEEKKEEEG